VVAGRLRAAVADAAETLRRLFREVPVHEHPAALPRPRTQVAPRMEVRCLRPEHAVQVQVRPPDWRLCGVVREEPIRWAVEPRREEAWDRWAAGAAVLTLEVFHPAARRRLAGGALPRTVRVGRLQPEGFRLALRQHRQPLGRAGVLRAAPAPAPPEVHRDMDRILGLPVAVVAEDLQRVPKALWMRYTLALVKATGENIRSLEVLGLFRVPARGVAALRHEPRTGRLLLELTREASGAPRVPLILARRKEDRAILTCFPEDGP